jgi:crotonobetainyl-CoA:carnitine CoA-transferase CaiB-like acyl-CoA transferase
VRHAGPDLGEHTAEVLGGLLGIDAATQDAWRARGII